MATRRKRSTDFRIPSIGDYCLFFGGAPSAQQLPSEVRFKVKAVPGVTDAWVEIVWEPPWDKDRMSEAAKLQLGFF